MKNIKVLIIGAGPVGLSLALSLARQNIKSIIIEKHPSTSIHPKARGVNVRTMELCRIWGVEDQIRQKELPTSARRLLWMDQIKGKIQGEVSFVSTQKDLSPTEPCLISQDIFEQELLTYLKKQENIEIFFNTRLIDFNQHDNFVECEIENILENTREKIQCEYLIGCDGANSYVRKKLAINMNGIPVLGTHVSVYCETDLSKWLADKPFSVLAFINKEQMGRVVMAVDLKQRWIFTKRIAEPNETLTEQAGIDLVRSTVDELDLPVKVLNIAKWEMAASNAEKYRDGRVFLCGDAAHRIPPTGGMGMNTGIGDAHNLAWKISYVLNHYADEKLLDSYEAERKPLAQITIDWSVQNAQRMGKIFQALIDGDREAFHAGLKAQNQQLNHPGLDLGFIYQSPAIYSQKLEKSAIPNFDSNSYTNKAIVGMRAPHCWILYNNKIISTLDLFEKNYVLLAGENCEVEKLKLPISKKYPLTTLIIGKNFDILDQDFYNIYQLTTEQAMLVRPDGHVAWVSK